MIFVAITQSPRRPVRPIHEPMNSSVRPTVSARTGFTGYISAVSMKVMPWSSAMSIWRCASASSVWLPQVMVPRQISVTSMPVRPSVVVFILSPVMSRFAVAADPSGRVAEGKGRT